MRVLLEAVRGHFWNDHRPAAAQAKVTLVVVLVMLVGAGWILANSISEKLTSIAAVLP